MPHQTIDLVDCDDARLLVDQAIATDGTQHLGIGQRLQDGVAFQLVEREDTRTDPVAPAARQIDVGGAIQKA
ncbi:MAG TPA: hypothetical protein PLQ56_20860 [Aggregatilineales bacterium]|nr:hypothetical protein [Aggregatilineales bacterium]